MASKVRKRKRKPIKKFTHKMQASLLLVFCIILICFTVLAIRLIKINADDGTYDRRVLSQQSYVSNAIPYKRGNILDRNGTILATSEKVYNMILDPAIMLKDEKYKEPTIKALTECFGVPAEEVITILKERPTSNYVIMKDYKGLSYEVVKEFKEKQNVKDSNIKGVWFEEEYARKYPLNNIASVIVGFTQKGNSNIGTWGIEEYYNEQLSGTNGREYGYFDADLNLERNVKPAINGNNVISTIDANVQSIVEKHVEQYLNKVGAKNIAVLLMNPQNGEIYSMASNYSFDLNNPRDLTPFYSEKKLEKMTVEEQSEALSKLWRNYCISNAYEPGSTIKPFTVVAALDEAIANGKSTYVCNGFNVVAGTKIKCNATHRTLDLKKSLMSSCNVVMMDIASKMGRSTFSDYVDLFGFGQKTGIDLPGEASGIIYNEKNLNPVELATASFGQSNTVTMIQMAAGFSSLINGGNYYEPHVVKQIENENGAVVETVEPLLVKETASKDASEKIRDYLYATVEKGTANPARVEGYTIGGKTGTAEKHPRGQGNYLVSFIGFTPVDDPKVVVYVIIDEPNKKEQDHSSYATQFASKLMKEVLPFLDVYPEE